MSVAIVLLSAAQVMAVTPADKCKAAKLSAAGKYGFCRLKAEAKAVKTAQSPDYSKCDEKIVDKFAKADATGGMDCPTSSDAAAIQSQATGDADDLVVLLSGGALPPCFEPLVDAILSNTGQTTSYLSSKNDGSPGSDAVPDDGAIEAGRDMQYVDNGDGTVTDLNTGLMWEKKSDDGGLHDKDNAYLFTWNGNPATDTIWDWLDDVNAENGSGFAGYNDWRIPNVKELFMLLDFERFPNIDPAFNTGCSGGCTVLTCSCTCVQGAFSDPPSVDCSGGDRAYWSSTSQSFSAANGRTVSYTSGRAEEADKDTMLRRVRAVRGGI